MRNIMVKEHTTWSDGRKYVGKWKNGKYNGQGKETSPDGTNYVGEWKDGKYNGQGTFTYPNGTKYVGGIQGWSSKWSRNIHLV